MVIVGRAFLTYLSPFHFSVGQTITLGFGGTGTLNVGGSVTSSGLIVGDNNTGTVTLSRTPDTLGGTGSLTVNGDLTLGAQLGATGTFNYNTAPGDAAMLTINNGALTVGDAGTGHFAQSGGSLTTAGLTIGNQSGSVGAVSVDGTGTSLISSQRIIVGNNGKGTLSVTNGATVSVTNGAGTTIAANPGSTSSSVSVSNGSTLIAGGTLTFGQNTGSSSFLNINSGGSALVGLTQAENPLGIAGGLAMSGTANMIFNIGAGQQTPDIVALGGSLQLGGTIQVQTSSGTTFTANTFIPLMEGSTINLDNLGGSVAFGVPLVDPNGLAIITSGNYTFDLTSQSGRVMAELLVPDNLPQMLVPEVRQDNIDGEVEDIFGLYVDQGMSATCRNNLYTGPDPLLNNTLTSITASFYAGGTSEVNSLTSAATECGFDAFNWQQQTNAAPPSETWELDPPQGGYSYCNPTSTDYNPIQHDCTQNYPYLFPSTGINQQNYCIEYFKNGNCETYMNDSDEVLNFFDSPEAPGGFLTQLVGVMPDGTPDLLPFDFTWSDTFSGTLEITSPSITDVPVDPSSGTGGITITSIDGVPTSSVPEPPSIASFATLLCSGWLVYRFRRSPPLPCRRNRGITNASRLDA